MSTEAAASQAKSADAGTLQKALNQLISGVGVTGVARVKERGPRTFDGRQTEVLVLESMGFAQSFYSEDSNEQREWPHTGDLVQFHSPITKSKDGGYKLSNPSCKVLVGAE